MAIEIDSLFDQDSIIANALQWVLSHLQHEHVHVPVCSEIFFFRIELLHQVHIYQSKAELDSFLQSPKKRSDLLFAFLNGLGSKGLLLTHN